MKSKLDRKLDLNCTRIVYKIFGIIMVWIQFCLWIIFYLRLLIFDIPLVLSPLFNYSLTLFLTIMLISHMRSLLSGFIVTSEIHPGIHPQTLVPQLALCEKCWAQRPQGSRIHHCSMCSRMDHHCFILGTCVGGNNYRYFFSYLFQTIIFTIIEEYFHFPYFLKVYQEYNVEISDIIPLVFSLFGILVYAGALFLFCQHIHMVAVDLTTLEQKFGWRNPEKYKGCKDWYRHFRYNLGKTHGINGLSDLFWTYPNPS